MGCKCFERKTQFTDTTSFDDKYKLSKCRCTSRFTVGENKSKFTIVSKQVSEVDKIKIDGYFDSSSKHRKCDYLFVYTPTSPSNCIYIFVELKGTDIAHAVTQIGNTVNLFYNQGYLKDKKVIGAIVSSRHPSNDGTYRKAKQTRHYKIFCVNGKYGIQVEFRIFYFIALQNEEDYERKESSSA